MVKVIIAGVFALVMVNIGVELVKSPEKGLAALLNRMKEQKRDDEMELALHQIATSKMASNVLRAAGWMMIGCALFLLYESLFG